MKTLLSSRVSTARALIMSATCFTQHYTQTNLVSNTTGVAPVTHPQLINHGCLHRDLKIARNVQRASFPQQPPAIPGLSCVN